jgi:glutathione S-transferase
MVRLYGSFTSPYVRRVRIVCEELGLPLEQVDSAPAEGQAELRKRNPIWKVPAAEVDGQLVLDSHVITELLLDRYGQGKLAPLPIDDLEARNAISIIDGALDALINAFYLEKEGVTFEQAPYLKKQRERAANALLWLDQNVHEPFVTSKKQLGLPEIALGTTLGWMRFRNVCDVEQYQCLMRCFEPLERRKSFEHTQPSG